MILKSSWSQINFILCKVIQQVAELDRIFQELHHTLLEKKINFLFNENLGNFEGMIYF